MKKSVVFLFILLFASFFGFAQSKFEKNPFSFADSHLKSGEYTVDLMAIDFPFETKLLMAKMAEAIAKDTAWFLNYMNEHIKDTGKLKYNKRLGLTEAEYNKMQEGISEGKQYVKVGEERLIVTNTDSSIRFNGTGRISELGHLVIHKRAKEVTFKNTSIPYKNEIHADDRTVVKAWDGHQFKLEELNTTDLTKIKEMEMKSYRLLLGKTQKTQRNYLKLEAKEIYKGEQPINIELALFF